MKIPLILLLSVSCIVACTHSFSGMRPNPFGQFIKTQRSKEQYLFMPVKVQPQDGLKEADKIDLLPGQPDGIDFNQYSGYATVDAKAGRALFYYFTESQEDSSTKPLVLWLNGGPGCSSLGYGAMMELGPFRVNSDGKTLHHNEYSWNKVGNILFLESPAGVGFSYSNTSSDYDTSGDKQTAQDAYVFLVNWLERFPEYKDRDFFIAGESYAGHYVPQLAQKILHNNIITNQTVINLQGIAIGNAWIDNETGEKGTYDFYWTHALISDETNRGINTNCNFSSDATFSDACEVYLDEARRSHGNIYDYDIYAPLCFSSSTKNSPPKQTSEFDPCSDDYIYSYLNIPQVQKSLHVTALPFPWEACNDTLNADWNDSPSTVLPVIQELMSNGIRVWIYSGDTDPSVPVTSTRYSIEKLGAAVKTSWYPWYTEGEVGGYAVGYHENLTFMTIRGAGHFTPSYQPARALAMVTSFLDNKLPPRNES